MSSSDEQGRTRKAGEAAGGSSPLDKEFYDGESTSYARTFAYREGKGSQGGAGVGGVGGNPPHF